MARENANCSTNGVTTATSCSSGSCNAKDMRQLKLLGRDNFEEFTFAVPWGEVRGKWWGPRDRQPLLALHGWQDNCGTFDRLCPLLSARHSVLAIDLPGHGHSSHYPQGMHYFIFWDGVSLIRRIVKHFGWQKMTLLGHSLGGALTFVYAASFPDDVERLINIDIAGPTVRNSDKLASQTGAAIDKLLTYETLPLSKQPCYSYEEMIALVKDAYDGSVDEPSVKILMKRGMQPLATQTGKQGYTFTRDLRLKMSMLGMFTAEQTLSYAKLIRCRVLNIRADPGMKFDNASFYEQVLNTMRLNAEELIAVKELGTHHLHLVAPEKCAGHINDFLLDPGTAPV